MSSAQATSYTAVHAPYIAACAAIASPGAKSKALVAVKNSARATLLNVAREMYSFVQANTTVTDANKALLGVAVRAQPTTNPVPSIYPAIEVVSVSGRLVKIRIHDGSGDGKRNKPAGVRGAAVCTFVGPVAPTNPALFTWQGSTNQPTADVLFPDTVPAGSLVWITATWFNNRSQTGPACPPISTYLQYGAMSQAA